MRLSTRGRFAINAMIDLALRQPDCPVALSELAARHGISLSYLEQVFAKLRQHGLVESTRGPGGGYTLGFRGDAISVADIVTAIEETTPVSESAQGDMTHALCEQLHKAMLEHMKTISLRGLALEQKAKGFQVQTRKPGKKSPAETSRAHAVSPQRAQLRFCLGQLVADTGLNRAGRQPRSRGSWRPKRV